MAAEGKKAEQGGASANHIFLHPLPLVSISEHHTRASVGGGVATTMGGRVLGVLFGPQDGLDVHITQSYELVSRPDGGIDLDFLRAKRKLMLEVFPTYDMLGMYSTGANPKADLDLMNTLFTEFNAGLYLVLDAGMSADAKELPVSVFQREVALVGDKARVVLNPVGFALETTEPERVVVDHLSKLTGAGPGSSALVSNLKAAHSAVKALTERVDVLLAFLRETRKGTIPANHTLLRKVAAICHMLPAESSDDFEAEFHAEYNDALLMTYLATMTKSIDHMNEVIHKLELTRDRKMGGRRRAQRGGMM